MKKKKKKHSAAKYIVLLVIFLAIVGISATIAVLHKKSVEEDFKQMESASLPLVSLSYYGYQTELHGYVNEMSLVTMRDVIVPLSQEKTIDVDIYSYGQPIYGLRYEIRSLDGTEFLDSGETDKLHAKGDRYSTTLKFSDLLESASEYQLILKLDTGSRTVYYYTRVLYGNTMYTEEILSFVTEFSDATYDREKASTFLVNFIQPDEDSDTTDYHYTTLHSKYAMLTYGNMTVEQNHDRLIRIQELEPTQVSVTLSYTIRVLIGEDWKTMNVSEFFSARYRSEKVYLLDYYRTVDEAFDIASSTKERGRILLGVSDGETRIINSDNNTYTVFIENREIWSYNSKTNAMSLIFSFKDENDMSTRSDYDHHDMQIVKVSDEGDIDYMVYGYMNRGTYEGEVGICFYRYSSEQNATKRLFYMPVFQSEQMLMMDLGTLAYVNDEDVCYLRYGDGIYSIDLNSGESVEVSIRAYPGMYAKNAKGNVVAWTEGDDLTYPDRLVILNMDSQTTIVVDAEEGQYVKILDFIGDDIVYGFGNRQDSIIQANTDTLQMLSELLIASTDEGLAIQKTYGSEAYFITSVEVYDTRVTIQRIAKTESGALSPLDDEVLLLTQSLDEDEARSMIVSRIADPQKKEYYIQIGNTSNIGSQFSSAAPRFEIQDAANVITLEHKQENVYYVYGYGRLLSVESEINKAITEAYNVFGVVVDEAMNYVWTRGTRDLFKTISIQPYRAASDDGTLAASLQVLCAQEGIILGTVSEDLMAGKSPVAIIDDALGADRAFSLYGCTLSEVLYFINEGHPVLAVMGDRQAAVISGYDTTNISVYDPFSGETVLMEVQEAERYFRQNNNAFISYR